MHDPTKMDYSKLFGFDMVANDVVNGVDFQNATIGAKLGAKVGKMTVPTSFQMMRPTDLPTEVTAAAGPIMQGLGGRTVSST